MRLFRKGKTHIIAKFQWTDLVICNHSEDGKPSSYSRINMVICDNKINKSIKKKSLICIFQLYDSAMVNAGLLDDPRSMVGRLNQLLEKAFEKI